MAIKHGNGNPTRDFPIQTSIFRYPIATFEYWRIVEISSLFVGRLVSRVGQVKTQLGLGLTPWDMLILPLDPLASGKHTKNYGKIQHFVAGYINYFDWTMASIAMFDITRPEGRDSD